jgi:hypothetical protein
MSYPKNPDTLIIKNKYYPKGLREIDIWNYYQKEKPRILNETRGRDLMFFIATDLNKFIVKRKGQKKNFIQLTNSNYDNVITGRTVSIHCSMKAYEDICVIDIDSDNLKEAKEATIDVYEIMIDSPFVNSAQIRFTGKTSFHIYCTLVRKIRIESVKHLVQKYLQDSNIEDKYTMQQKRSGKVPNIDLSPLKIKGNFITLNSLSIFGLKCIEVPYMKMDGFNPYQTTIKI